YRLKNVVQAKTSALTTDKCIFRYKIAIMRKHAYAFIPAFILLAHVYAGAQQNKPAVNYGSNAAAGKHITTRGTTFYYETYGKGEPLLLIHGNSGSINNFKYQIPYFS